MEKIEIKASRWKNNLMLLASLFFVAAGIWMITEGERMGWVAILFFGGCVLVFIRQLVDSRPRLIIDKEGINDRMLGVGRICWEEIEGFYIKTIYGNDFICLELEDSEKYVKKLSKTKRLLASANRALGFTDLSINLSGLDISTEDAFETMLKYTELSRLQEEKDRVKEK